LAATISIPGRFRSRPRLFYQIPLSRRSARIISADHTKQDFHSLAVADFDNDGDLDVYSGGGPLSPEVHKLFIWENADGKAGVWTQHVILEGKQCHEAKAADVDGDADIDICTKPWSGSLHIYLRNMLVEDKKASTR
jgi:hypothetical protein